MTTPSNMFTLFKEWCCRKKIHSFTLKQTWENNVNPRWYCTWCTEEVEGVYGYDKAKNDI